MIGELVIPSEPCLIIQTEEGSLETIKIPTRSILVKVRDNINSDFDINTAEMSISKTPLGYNQQLGDDIPINRLINSQEILVTNAVLKFLIGTMSITFSVSTN